jgi:general stress protein 26
MSRQDSIQRVWDIIEKVGVCMLATRFPGGLRARPLEARPDPAASLIWFVTDLRSRKDDDIDAAQDVCLVFIDAKEKAYLSLTGRADVLRDPAKAAEIWKKTDDAWWDGPRDPNVCVLRVEPLTAELWDGPSSAAVAATNSPRRASPAQSRTWAKTARSWCNWRSDVEASVAPVADGNRAPSIEASGRR